MVDNLYYEKQVELDVPLDLGMYYCGKRVNSENHQYGPRIIDHILIILVNDGNAYLHSKNTPLKKHDLFVMFPNERVHYKSNGLWSIQCVGVYGKSVMELLEKIGITPENPVTHVYLYRELEAILKIMYETADETSLPGKLNSMSLLYEFFSVLLKNANYSPKPDIVESAIRIMKYNYNQNISVATVADSLHLNTAYFSRVFSEKTGISPKQYILNLKIQRAKELLIADVPISEVAESIGFSDPCYFSRIFHQKTGLTPSQFVKDSENLAKYENK